ncbi:unnamed protein product [Vitrella brassicaformis CCMP3155]|uniref:Peptidase S1 domain-containing protein n=1 Tax=Vitrella brassicaformis (strain CCMP3155) TaxID=1169540 RepID=A0A0G4F5W7_VITBC|nr:unnamed protein product [Vitrella brassicaformis CCMP3155]|eukprot:CEM07610.1 unnamed protein product [Vitrella brassicaformis CCMP3155]
MITACPSPEDGSNPRKDDVGSLCNCQTFTPVGSSAPRGTRHALVANEQLVCADNEITFATGCLALCQKQTIRHQGSCEDINKGAIKLGNNFAFVKLSDIRESAGGAQQLTPAVVHRFRDQGYVFIGRLTGGTNSTDRQKALRDSRGEAEAVRLERVRTVRIVPGGDTYARLRASTYEEMRQRLKERGISSSGLPGKKGSDWDPKDVATSNPRPLPLPSTFRKNNAVNHLDNTTATLDLASPECVFDGESRTRAGPQEDYPWRAFGYLEIEYDDGQGGRPVARCSGTVAGGPSFGLTAAHCFTDKLPEREVNIPWMDRVIVLPAGNWLKPNWSAKLYPGQSWYQRPYGPAKVDSVEVAPGWLYQDTANRGIDWTVMHFTTPIGDQTGFLGVGLPDLGHLAVCGLRPDFTADAWMLSYPGTGADNEQLFYEHRRDFPFCDLGETRVNHKFDSNGGASGAGIVVKRDDSFWQIALNNAGIAGDPGAPPNELLGNPCDHNIAATTVIDNYWTIADIMGL